MLGRRQLLRHAAAALGAAAAVQPARSQAASADAWPGVIPADVADDADRGLAEAIDACAAAGGGVVLVPIGEHRLTRDVRLRSNVTLRGLAPAGTRLVGASVVHEPGVVGATIEDLTIEQGGVRYEPGESGLAASFCTLRRLRVRQSPGDAVHGDGGAYEHLWLDDVTVEDCAGSGLALDATAPCRSVFVTALGVDRFGGTSAIRLRGRCQMTLVRVDPVGTGRVAIAFEPGSDHSVVTNLTIASQDGTAFSGRQDRSGVVVGPVGELDP